jgi:hypothetical protein
MTAPLCQRDRDTLVVYTTNFAYAEAGTSWGVPSSEWKHAIERFSLVDDGARLRYEYIVEDREYLEAPVVGMALLSYRPDLQPSGVECDVENSSRFLFE